MIRIIPSDSCLGEFRIKRQMHNYRYKRHMERCFIAKILNQIVKFINNMIVKYRDMCALRQGLVFQASMIMLAIMIADPGSGNSDNSAYA
jgi:hypothetical protein